MANLELKKIALRDLVYRTLMFQYKFACLQSTQLLYIYEDGIYIGGGRAEDIIRTATEKALKDIFIKDTDILIKYNEEFN